MSIINEIVLLLYAVLVRLGCYSKTIINWVTYTNKHLFLIVLKADPRWSANRFSVS